MASSASGGIDGGEAASARAYDACRVLSGSMGGRVSMVGRAATTQISCPGGTVLRQVGVLPTAMVV